MTVPYNEERALELLAEGDQAGFKMLYEHYAPRVGEVAYLLLRSEAQADDLLQEVFIQVWVERERFLAVDKFEAYLFTCVRNHALRCIKKSSRENEVRMKAASLKDLDENSVDNYIRKKELAGLVQEAVEQLPTQRRRVFTMSTDEGLSHADIATQLNIDPLTVKNHVHYARSFIWDRIHHHIVVSLCFALPTSLLC